MKYLKPTIFFLTFFACLIVGNIAQAATCNDQADGNWNSVATWSCGLVPDADDDVTIDSHTVTMTADQSSLAVTISGGTLNMSSYTLSVYGNWAYTSGTLNAGTSRLTFSNTGATQTFTPGNASYYNLRTNKSAYDLSVSGTAKVLNEFRMSGGANSSVVNGVIEAEGDVIIDSTVFYGGTTVIKLVGDNN